MRILVITILFFTMAIAHGQTSVFLIGRTLGDKILPSGDTMRVFGFAPNLGSHPPIPGPLIEANQGDSVIIDFWNVSQLHKHTIHLHGLDVDQQNDGVPMLSFDVDHMEHGWYRFKAPHAGTYLYHCHVGSTLHLQAGMYGPIIIRPSDGSNTTWDGGYPFDTETMLFMSEFDTFWHTDSILDHNHDSTAVHDTLTVPKFNPDYFNINGLSDQQLEDSIEVNSKTDYVNYVRLVNIGYCSNTVIFPSGLSATLIDSDGRPLPLGEVTDTVEIYPGERYGVLFESSAPITDSIQVIYHDMMNGTVKDTQYVKVDIQIPNEVHELTSINSLRVMPNPADVRLWVEFNSTEANNLNCRITDLNGKLIHSQSIQSEPGKNRTHFNISNYSSGTYLLSIWNSDSVVTEKFIKL